MKFFNTILGLFLCILLVGTTTLAGQKYVVANGNWTATTTWSLTRGGASGAAIPTSTDTAWIPSPYKVIYDVSAKTCYNLIVESGAALYSATANPTNSQVYLRVWGDSVRNDGVIGYDPAAPTVMTAMCFESYAPGKTLTFKGSGISMISRIRGGNNLSQMTIVIDQDMTLTYTGSSGTGGVAYYPSQGIGNLNTLKINAGRTVTIVDQGFISNGSSASSDGKSATITVDGTVLMQGPNSSLNLRSAIADSAVTFIVNGLVDVGGSFKPTSSAGAIPSNVVINAGGVLKVGTSGSGVIGFDGPAQTVTGAGTFTIGAGCKVQIGSTYGLDPVNGPIRTTVRNLNNGNKFEFVGNAAAMVTGSEFPSKVQSLILTDSLGGTLTLTNSVTIDTALTLNYGKLITGSKFVALGPAATISGASALNFVDGTVKEMVAAAGAKKWETGQGTDYLPFAGGFSGITGWDYVSVQANDATGTTPAGPVGLLTKMLTHFYRVAKGPALTAVTADSLVLGYLRTDVAAQGLTSDLLKVFRYDGAQWAAVTVKSVDTASNTLTVTGAIPNGDFVIAAAATAPPTAAFPEDFNYPTGDSLTWHSWLVSSGGTTNAILTTTPGLTFTNYPSSGIGNATTLTTSGQDVFKSFPKDSGSSFYSALMLKVSAAQATGDYFFALSPAESQTNYYGRLFIKSSGSGFVFGISKSNEAAVYGSTVFSFNTTYLAVVKYTFDAAKDSNDIVRVYALAPGALLNSEPGVPEIVDTAITRADAKNFGFATLRQGTTANAPSLTLDGIRIEKSWNKVMGSVPAAAIYSVGTGTVPGETEHYATLKAACDSINAQAGNITADRMYYITSNLTEPANVAVAGNTNGNTITFKPYAGVTSTITFAQVADNVGLSGGWVIGVKNLAISSTTNYGVTLNDSTQNIVIDGSNTVGGKTRDLSIVTAAGVSGNANPIRIFGNTNNIVVKNVVVSTGQSVSYAILITPRQLTTAGYAGNYIPDNITIDNCDVTNTFGSAGQGIAISASGTPTVFPTGIVFSNNKVTATTRGIFLNYSGNTGVYGNQIYLRQTGSGSLSEGIFAYIIGAPTNVTNIYNNKILLLSSANVVTGTAAGIEGIWIATQGIYNVYNNFITGFTLAKGTQGIHTGIGISTGTANGITANVYHNSVNIGNGSDSAGATPPIQAAFYLNLTGTTGTRVVNLANNAFASNDSNYATYAMYVPATNLGTLTSDYNDLYTAGGSGKIGKFGATDCATLADWKTASATDAHSVSGDPKFVSSSDLHITATANPISVVSNAGTAISGFTTDIDGDVRDALHPDIGADEYVASSAVPVFSAAPASLDFKSVTLNQTKSDSVVVKNTGTDSLIVSGVTIADNSYTVTPTTARIAAQASQKFTVTFTPTTVGTKASALVFTTNDVAGKDTVKVSGNGAGPLVPVTLGEARKDANGDLIADHSITKDTLLVYGIITSPNFQATQTSYFMQDATGGINLFSYTLVSTPLLMGDSVAVTGTVAQYHGLTEFMPLTLDAANLTVLKHNATVPTPKLLTLHQFVTNAESYEGQLIEVDTLYKATGTWPASGSYASVYVTNKSKADTVQMFLDNDTNIDGTPEPAYPINVVGIVSQYSSATTVYNNGYELMPRDTSDIKHVTGMGVNQMIADIPTVYELQNNYPNPFNPSTTLRYGLPSNSKVTLKIYNILGQVVAELVNAEQAAGWHTTIWNASVASGMYFYRIEATSTNDPNNRFVDVKKMLLLK
jgi:hypothetical protein